ncbi:MAG: RNA polymerase sigma factor [Deltaproteobacteria bacterium]|nr:RNA polymerase sigma factor [Deltaproteobacteria bacterium]
MPVSDRISAIYKAESRKVLATLVRLLGDFDLAEEALHDAFGVASERWPREGIPSNPRAWLVSTGRFKGIDAQRRRGRGDALVRDLAETVAQPEPDAIPEPWDSVHDDQLRLVFTCCHPVLAVDARVALSLREICGLRTDEIARCFLVPTETMKKRISRAKAVLREQQIPYVIPSKDELGGRLAAVLHVIYLVFNEGYAATSGDAHIRHELTHEALFLGRHLVELIPRPEAMGLLALMLLHESRTVVRVDAEGNIIPLEAQDRSRWDRSLITEARLLLQRAIMSGRVGPYTLQAAIASVHAVASSVEDTHWGLIVDYYDMLLQVQPGPVVELQRSVAVAMRDGPAAGLELVEALLASGRLASVHSVHAIRADLARRLGRLDLASSAYETAIELSRQGPERRYLEQQLEKLSK